MKTRIDNILNDYMQTLLQKNMIDFENIKILMNAARKEFELDAVFFMENNHYMYTLSNTYLSADHIEEWNLDSIHLKEEEYQKLLNMYGESGLSEELYMLPVTTGSMLHCGMVSNDFFYGLVGWYKKDEHEWSEEEKTALLMITRALFFFVEQKRRKAGKEQDFTYHMSDVVRVNASEYYIDLNEDTCHGYKINGLMRNVFPEWSKYSETFKKYCNDYVAPGYEKIVRHKFSLEALKCNLNMDNPEITEEHLITINNESYWLKITAKLMDLDEQNRPNHVIFITEDITENITEKERSYYSFRLLKENFYQINSVNLETNRYIYLKENKEDIFVNMPNNGSYSWQVETIYNTVIHPNDKEKFINAWDVNRLIEHFDKTQKTVTVDYRQMIHGKYQWVRAEFVPNQEYGPGNRQAIIYLKDISEEMGKQEEQMSIISSLTNIYFKTYYISLEDNRIVDMRTLEDIQNIQITEERAEAFVYKTIAENVTDEYYEKVREFSDLSTVADRLSEKKMLSLEYMSKNDGWIRGHFIPVQWDKNGKITHVLYAKSAIDEEKKRELDTQSAMKDAYEAASRANNAKTEFLSRVSHDIRTPMNAIIGMTAIAAAYLDDKDRIRDCLGKITASSRHLLSLINEVLDMSKIESGKIDISEEEFNLAELIENMIVMVNPLIADHEHELKVHLDNLQHEDVIGDSLRIQQVFMNIMSNAVKYTPNGGKIQLDIHEIPSRQKKIATYEFVFTDNGIGMSQEYIDHIFEPFSREEDSRTNVVQGTGLGMPIVLNIIKMMGGKIDVESEKGKGSKFTVTIQLKIFDKEENSVEDLAGLPVLVADDDQIVCESTCVILNQIGMEGEWVLSGEEAVEKTVLAHSDDNDYFAVILDWKMPTMDGIETARQIRKRVGPTVPIIVLTAYDWSKIEMEARQAGVDAFLPKPMFKTSLIRLFHQLKNGEIKEKDVESAEILKEKDYSDKRILVVEDQEFNREIAKIFLNMSGVMVEEAENGKQAVSMVERSAEDYYDLIFMDIQMPIMNGYDATRAIRALKREDVKQLPIIAMTANAFAEDVNDAKSAGMNEHIAKPIELPKFKKVLEEWLEK